MCINSVYGFSAAAVMSQTGQFVTLKVGKQSAVYYGLATQLGQQSPPPAISNPPFQSMLCRYCFYMTFSNKRQSMDDTKLMCREDLLLGLEILKP